MRSVVSYTAHPRALLWIALANFVLPVIFNVVLLILVQDETFSNIVTVIAVISVNVYVQIVSGILATLWCHAGVVLARVVGTCERESSDRVNLDDQVRAPDPERPFFAYPYGAQYWTWVVCHGEQWK